jgi:molybdenum cofactor cytidylyltransferase
VSAGIAAILLAAGKSRRMGCCKQLLPLGGSTVIDRCLDTLFKGGADEVVVVISEAGQSVAEAVSAYPVRTVVNPDPEGDMASSVRTGRDAISSAASGVLICLCDYPLVSANTITGMITQHQLQPDQIIIPCFDGQRGHPLLFPGSLLDRLETGMILRDLIREHPQQIHYLETEDPGILMDMDTPEDYRRICNMIQVTEFLLYFHKTKMVKKQ